MNPATGRTVRKRERGLIMTIISAQAWREALLAYAEACRTAVVLASRDSLTSEENCRSRHIGGSIYGWLKNELPMILQQRAMLQHQIDFADDPLIIVTTEMSGLVAAYEILRLPAPEIACLLKDEFDHWEGCNADPDFIDHMHYWNYFRAASASEKAAIIEDGLLTADDEIRLHVIGCLWGKSKGMETTHLWQWRNEQMLLIQEGYLRIEY